MRPLIIVVLSSLVLAPTLASAGIRSGTELVGQMDMRIDSRDAQVGQRFTVSHVHSQSNDIHDAVIYGHVTRVTRPTQGRSAQLGLTYDKLHTNAGNSYALTATTLNIPITTKSNAVKEGVGAVAGMVVGNYVGKILDTNAGGAIGAAGGYLYAKNSRADIAVAQGSEVAVRVDSAERRRMR